jgi:small GTP-binding protein
MNTGPGIAKTRNKLHDLLTELLSIAEDSGAVELARRAGDLLNKLKGQQFVVAVVGEFKRGKSTFINALLGAQVLPVGAIPVTAAVTVATYGPVPRMEVIFADGATEVADLDVLARYVTERENPGNRRNVARVVVEHPAALLADGVQLVDTPGVGSIHQHNTDTTRQFLSKVDAAVFVTSADQPISHSERAFLEEVSDHAAGMFFVLNKTDVLQAGDVNEVVDFTTQALSEAIGHRVVVYPISALAAFRARLEGHIDGADRSGMARFEEAFAKFLTDEKANVLARSVARNAVRLVAGATNAVRVEAETMRLPVDAAANLLTQLEDVAARASASRRDLEALLEMEARQLMGTIEADLVALRHVETERLLAEAHRVLDEHPDPRSAGDDLDRAIADSLRQSIGAWRQREDEKVAVMFRAATTRFSDEMADLLERTTRLCSQLFDVDLSSPPQTDIADISSEFTFTFFDPPDEIQMTIEAIRRRTPASIARRMLGRKIDEDIPILVDKHCGRLRWDYSQRLDKIRVRLTGELAAQLEATLDGLRRGVERARERRAVSESDLTAASTELNDTLRRLEKAASGLHTVTGDDP